VKEAYLRKRFKPETRRLISQADAIIDEYLADGLKLSLRQLYYQFVARGILENNFRNYKRLGSIISDARLAGLIDWDAIEDRGRETDRATRVFWDGPQSILEACAEQFKIDRWLPQPHHVEVMAEKAALEGVLIPVCAELGVRFTANKGYSSQSFMREKGEELARWRRGGFEVAGRLVPPKYIHVLYLGDHDPSGMDMDRDVVERLELFSRGPVKVKRLCLTMDQIDDWGPPPNYAKPTDSRSKEYRALYGDDSWELDAAEPRELVKIVREAVVRLRDDELWEAECERQAKMRADLRDMALEYEYREAEASAGDEDDEEE